MKRSWRPLRRDVASDTSAGDIADYIVAMPYPQPAHHEVRTSGEYASAVLPHEDFGRLTVPLVGDVDVALGLGQPLRLEIDADAVELQFGSGLEVRPVELPSARLRRLYVDLVDGVVETDSDGLGEFLPRALAVALCSVLRHALGWTPGGSMLHAAAARLFPGEPEARHLKFRRRFPGVVASLDPLAILSVEVRGDALEVAVSRPLVIRAVGLSLSVLRVRYDFATATVEVVSAPVGPVRRALVRAAARQATRWLRRRLPEAMREPGYDLFADPERREHLVELVHRLRADDHALQAGPSQPAGAEGTPGHPRARERERGAASLFSGAKAAIAAGIATLRISADEPPPATRPLFTIPLGPFSSLAIATDRGGDVAVIKAEDGLRLDAPRGIYLYSDQFPELAELRLRRARIHHDRDDVPIVDVQTEPALGPLLAAIVQRASDRYVVPLVPARWLREHGALLSPQGGEHHVLWRQPAGGEHIQAHTRAGFDVELRHGEDALVLTAPGGLSLGFPAGWHVPSATLRRVAYRWEDGALEIDGDPGLGEFGQAVLAAIARHEAPRAPGWLGLREHEAPALDEGRLARLSVEVMNLSLPVLGRLELRMDPQDTLGSSLGPAELAVRSERGLCLVARDLGLMIELRGARYDLPRHELVIDASPPVGDFLLAYAAASLEAYVLPALRKVVPLWPDADPNETWLLRQVMANFLGEKLGLAFDLTLPPGASLTAARVAGALAIGATAPLQVRPVGQSLIGEFAVESVRWRPDGEQIELVTQPPAGPLLHALVRRLHAHFTPKVVLHALAERLGLPQPWPPPPLPPAPASAPVGLLELPVVGPLTVHVDRQRPLTASLSRDGARLDFGEGCVVRMPDLGIHVDTLGATVTQMPFTVELASRPQAGELDNWILSHVVRGMLARVLPWFWPAHHATAGEDILVAFGAHSEWGPIEVCAPTGTALELVLDADGVAVRSPAGARLAGPALAELPAFTFHEAAYRFADGSVQLRVAGVEERYYHEPAPVGAHTEAVLADLLRVLVIPRVPAFMQRLGLRILPPPPTPEPDPGRITVLHAQLPGGFANVLVHVQPGDVLTVMANRREVTIASQRGLQCDVPGLRMRIDFTGARYHLESGEVQIGEFGQLENALVEALVRRFVAGYEPAATESDFSAVAALLDRFPVDDEGRRVLFDSKLARVLLPPDTMLVVSLGEHGLIVTADPPIEIDGATVLDYKFAGVSYSFEDASFHLDIERDGVLAGLLRGKLVEEGEQQLNNVLRPLLPAAMREPGYRLSRDPDPKATIAALVRTVAGTSWFLAK